MKRIGLTYKSFLFKCLMAFALIPFLGWGRVLGQSDPDYEEITVFLMVQRLGGIEIPAVYRDPDIYLPVQDIFDYLKIKCTPTPTFDSISGFFIDPQAKYVVDYRNHRITYSGKHWDLDPKDLVRTETNLYLKINYFGDIFGLDCTFNFRALSVSLNTTIELPVIRDLRLELVRSNIRKVRGEVKADTTYPASHPFLRFGNADWAVTSSQEIGGDRQSRFNLGLGAMLAGGEAKVLLQQYSGMPFTEREQQYLWRYVNNDHAALRQVIAGKIATQATSSIFNPVVGMQLTNAPTTYRRSFGTYTLTDYTEPDWSVELYVNNVLVDFVKADASGFFKFEVPLMYGSTMVMLRFYGPYGEERFKQQTITIPYNFLPAREFQYVVSGGMVEDTLHSIFSRASANYGVSRFLTVGGGMEYLSSVTSGPYMPFVNTSLKLGPNLMFAGDYTYGVRGKGILNYRTAGNFQVELDYTKYHPGQKAIIFNYLEERKALISFPVRIKRFTAYSRIGLSQYIMPATRYSTAEWLLSGAIRGVSTNLTTYAMFPDQSDPYIYSNLTLGFRLPGRIMFRPQAQYVFSTGELMLVKAEVEKQFFKSGYLNLSYENNLRMGVQNIQVGFRYDFSFAQTSFTFRKSNAINTMYESAQGSLLFNRKTKYVGVSNRSSVGRGGIVVISFLDTNGNGRYDKGESRIPGLKININGGRVVYSQKDTVIRVFDLEPYTRYLIELDKFSFDNIAWQMSLKNVAVVVDPNGFKRVEIPVSILGEAAGTVTFKGTSGEKGLGRMLVDIYGKDGTLVKQVMTEPDGYFSYLGLKPGSYVARVDTVQLNKLEMTSDPSGIPFVIEQIRDGDVKDDLNFNVRSIRQDVPQSVAPAKTVEQKPEGTAGQNQVEKQVEKQVESPKTELKADTKAVQEIPKREEVQAKPVASEQEFYYIQLAASRDFIEPVFFRNKFKLDQEVFYFEKDGWYKYVTGKFATSREAVDQLKKLGVNGFVTHVAPSLLKK